MTAPRITMPDGKPERDRAAEFKSAQPKQGSEPRTPPIWLRQSASGAPLEGDAAGGAGGATSKFRIHRPPQ